MESLQATIEKASKKIRSTAELREALVRNSFYVPKLKSAVVTEEYLLGVMEGKYWVPIYGQFSIFLCP